MKKFIGANKRTAEELESDEDFRKRRDALNAALAGIASNALPDMLDAWGVLAMDTACGREAVLHGVLLTPGPIVVKDRP